MSQITVGVIFAMRGEASHIFKAKEWEELKVGTFPRYELKNPEIPGLRVILGFAGHCDRFKVDQIGTVSAAINTQEMIQYFSPGLIINAGTAGGFQEKGHKIGDVFFAGPHIFYHDRRISIDGFHERGRGSYSPLSCTSLLRDLNLLEKVVSTGDSFDTNELDLEEMNAVGSELKEMEAASMLQVCDHYQIPFMALKSVTDFIDSHECNGKAFARNLNYASEELSKKVAEVLEYLSGKKIREL